MNLLNMQLYLMLLVLISILLNKYIIKFKLKKEIDIPKCLNCEWQVYDKSKSLCIVHCELKTDYKTQDTFISKPTECFEHRTCNFFNKYIFNLCGKEGKYFKQRISPKIESSWVTAFSIRKSHNKNT